MFVEHPPKLYRLLFPGAIWRLGSAERRTVYLTFDDGPVPEATPQVLDMLDRHGVKATFFMVGDNARRYPELAEEVRRRGHTVGNHTMHHLQGIHTPHARYMADVAEADTVLGSRLFRPPHGLLRPRQLRSLQRAGYNIIMYDIVTRDYAADVTAEGVVDTVRRYVRPGSVIVFHDSRKSLHVLLAALEKTIVWLKNEGYDLLPIVT